MKCDVPGIHAGHVVYRTTKSGIKERMVEH